MALHLDAELESAIQEKVESGRYGDANAVVAEAIRLLDEHDKLCWLREAVVEADLQFERGEFEEWTPDFLQRLSEEADEMASQGLRPHAAVLP